MLDAEHAHLTKTGTVLVEAGRIVVTGFEGHNASCRDVAALALVWAIGVLQQELRATMEKPGGGNVCVG